MTSDSAEAYTDRRTAKSADVTIKVNVIYGAIHLCDDFTCPCVYRQAYRMHQLTPGLKSCILNTRMHSMDMILVLRLEEGLLPRYDIHSHTVVA